ncbi:MAG: molybdenum cofactor guanylyltransferase [Chloroflexi bacterium]|nr:molybdenum cofactor guanylyltransferase [Chloroflexota bacterium]
MQITGIVLAGGKSRRLGKDKATLVINGKSLIKRVVESLKSHTNEILIVTAQDQINLPGHMDAEIVSDIYPEKGPLGGICTGLMRSRSSHNLVVACDMPSLNTGLLDYMVRLSSDFDAIVPRIGQERLEPLHAVYSRRCLSSIRQQLEAGNLEAYSFLTMVRVRYVETAECQMFDPHLLSFFNINRQSDLDRASMLVAESSWAWH